MFISYLLQTEGQARTTATNAGFITGLYVVFAPLLAAGVFGMRVPRTSWVAVAGSLAGLTLLSVQDLAAIRLHPGDMLVLGGALGWAAHIVAVGRYSPRLPAWALSVAQMAVAATLHTALALALPGVRPTEAVQAGVWPLLVITGVLGSGVAFTIQVMAQRTVTAPRAVVVLAGESLVAASLAAVWIGERLVPHQWVGATLVLGAMAFSELAARRPAAIRLDPAVP
jgi:drug/metabolite transporter (DMT)-like permease